MRESAESQADNLAKTTVECPWVRDWKASLTRHGVCSLVNPALAAIFGGGAGFNFPQAEGKGQHEKGLDENTPGDS